MNYRLESLSSRKDSVVSVPFKKPAKQTHPDFARRILQAADANYQVPPPNEGRLRWFTEQLEKKGHDVSMETVRKWFAGLTVPRPRLLVPLAEILKVDAGWLAVGTPGKVNPKAAQITTIAENGAANMVAGFIQMDGGTVAFANEEDPARKERGVDLHAIIKGAKYEIHVALAFENENGQWVFRIPVEAAETIILGVKRGDGFAAEIYELDRELVEEFGTRDRGHIFVAVDTPDLRIIKSFSERL